MNVPFIQLNSPDARVRERNVDRPNHAAAQRFAVPFFVSMNQVTLSSVYIVKALFINDKEVDDEKTY